jgi:hypothetical protein
MNNRDTFKQWVEQQEYTPNRLAAEAGIPVNVVHNCLYNPEHEDMNPRRMSVEYRLGLHRVTGLDMFALSPQNIAGTEVDLTTLNPWQHELLGWMSEHNQTMSMLSQAAGLSRSSVRLYCKTPSDLQKISKKNQRILYEHTQIGGLAHAKDYEIDDDSSKEQSPTSQTEKNISPDLTDILSEVQSLKKLVSDRIYSPGSPKTNDELVKRTHSTFVDLVDLLEQYKTKTEAIDDLRQRIPPRTAGYVVSLLNALYANDQMSKWLLQQPMPIEVRK